jgi:hypothetical protein
MPRKLSPVTPPGFDPGTFRLVAQCTTEPYNNCYHRKKAWHETNECGAPTLILMIPVAGDSFSKTVHEGDCLLSLTGLQDGQLGYGTVCSVLL